MTGENAPGKTGLKPKAEACRNGHETFRDEQQRVLLERVQGREAELENPQRRAELVAQLAEEIHIHSDFIDGFLLALKDPSSEPFEKRSTLRLPALDRGQGTADDEPHDDGDTK